MIMKKFTYALFATSMMTGAANAQSVDYSTLESIFGEPVTTSATGKPQRVSEAPVAMKIITQEEIHRSGAKDIPQVLQRIAGVEVSRPENGRADVSIRGYNQPLSNRLLVLIDGRQVLTDGFGFVPWGNLPVLMEEIRQIEVVKGPNSSLFGFNAEQGVINIITFSPLKDDVDVANVKFGNREHREFNGANTVELTDNQALRMSFGWLGADQFNRDGITANVADHDRASSNGWDRRNFGLDHEWQIDGTSQLRTKVNYINGKVSQLGPSGFAANPHSHRDNRSIHFSYKKQSDYGLWDVTAYRNSYKSTGSYDNDLNVVKVENLFKYGSHHAFRLGGEYRYNTAQGPIMGGSTFDYDLWAPSAMWDWKISPKFSWTNSVRYDHVQFGRDDAPTTGSFSYSDFDRKVEEISFNSGLVYNYSSTDKFRLSVARGLHIPSLIEMGSSQALLGGAVPFFGDPTLQTERNLTAELGYSKKLPQHNANVGASIYFTKLENVIASNIEPTNPTVVPINFTFSEGGDSELFGLELEADGKYDGWLKWGANYTYTTVSDEDNGGSLVNFEDYQPEHQVSIYGGFESGDWEFDADLHYLSGSTHKFEGLTALASQLAVEELEQYFVLNARVGYNYNDNTSISIDGFNLVDKHREWAYGTDAIAGPTGGNTIGRTVLLNMKHHF